VTTFEPREEVGSQPLDGRFAVVNRLTIKKMTNDVQFKRSVPCGGILPEIWRFFLSLKKLAIFLKPFMRAKATSSARARHEWIRAGKV
jgi:hypothetical protein